MCGIAGTFGKVGLDAEQDVARMLAAIATRGPDQRRVLAAPKSALTMGFVRLAIVDVSDQGAQPMASACGRFLLTFNGEIYNHRALRAELETLAPQTWRGHSDTEVLLAGICHWGLEATLQRASGMFALALWDNEKRTLQLARDRFGEKPLYYGRLGAAGNFVYASDPRAVLALPDFSRAVNRNALSLFLRYGHVPDPHCIFSELQRLAPAHILTLEETELERDRFRTVDAKPYWVLCDVVLDARRRPLTGSLQSIAAVVEAELDRAVGEQLEADVPLGAFLSGGIDSSLVVSSMRKHRSEVRTFSIGNEVAAYDESTDARRMATALGTMHTEHIVTDREARAWVDRLPEIFAEPFADSSQIPTLLVAELAKREVTVALSGDGGDEVFGGYNRHVFAEQYARILFQVPGPMRRAFAFLLRSLPPQSWDRALGSLTRKSVRLLGDKLHKAARAIAVPTWQELYTELCSQGLGLGARTALPNMDALRTSEQMMVADALAYLPGDILVKVDRATMAHSLEARAPFLNHNLYALAWRVPLQHKICGGKGKAILRHILAQRVPRELFERPKTGFGVPVDAWLRGAMRSDLRETLAPRELRKHGWLDAEHITKLIDEHDRGSHNHQSALWSAFMLQKWYQRWIASGNS